MDRLLMVLLATLVPTGAAAEVVATKSLDGSLGTSAETTSGSVSTSRQSAELALDASADVEVPIEAMRMPEGWKTPGLGGGVTLDGALLGAICEGCEATREIDLKGDAELRLHVPFVTGFYRETYQRPVQFDDGYWRNERGTIRRALGFRAKGFEVRTDEMEADLISINWERRELYLAELGNYFSPEQRLGDEFHFGFSLGCFTVVDEEDNAMGLELLTVGFGYYVVPPAGDTNTDRVPILVETPPEGSLQAYELDVTAIGIQVAGPYGALGFDFGVTTRRPAESGGINDPEASAHVNYSVGYGRALSRDHVPGWRRFGERRPRHSQIGWLVQAEDFHRIDSSGLAVDKGHQLGAEVAWGPVPSLTLSARGALVYARRTLISSLRHPDAEMLAEVGDTLFMGRAETQVDWEFAEFASLTGTMWAERSDRADPFRPAVHGAIVPFDTNIGAWVGLSFQAFD